MKKKIVLVWMIYINVIQTQIETILEKTNQVRQNNSTDNLLPHSILQEAAQAQASLMCTNKALIHTESLQKRMLKLDYIGPVGENIARSSNDNIEKIMDIWLKSSTHRKNLLGQWNVVGIGQCWDTDGWYYLVEIFGRNENVKDKKGPENEKEDIEIHKPSEPSDDKKENKQQEEHLSGQEKYPFDKKIKFRLNLEKIQKMLHRDQNGGDSNKNTSCKEDPKRNSLNRMDHENPKGAISFKTYIKNVFDDIQDSNLDNSKALLSKIGTLDKKENSLMNHSPQEESSIEGKKDASPGDFLPFQAIIEKTNPQGDTLDLNGDDQNNYRTILEGSNTDIKNQKNPGSNHRMHDQSLFEPIKIFFNTQLMSIKETFQSQMAQISRKLTDHLEKDHGDEQKDSLLHMVRTFIKERVKTSHDSLLSMFDKKFEDQHLRVETAIKKEIDEQKSKFTEEFSRDIEHKFDNKLSKFKDSAIDPEMQQLVKQNESQIFSQILEQLKTFQTEISDQIATEITPLLNEVKDSQNTNIHRVIDEILTQKMDNMNQALKNEIKSFFTHDVLEELRRTIANKVEHNLKGILQKNVESKTSQIANQETLTNHLKHSLEQDLKEKISRYFEADQINQNSTLISDNTGNITHEFDKNTIEKKSDPKPGNFDNAPNQIGENKAVNKQIPKSDDLANQKKKNTQDCNRRDGEILIKTDTSDKVTDAISPETDTPQKESEEQAHLETIHMKPKKQESSPAHLITRKKNNKKFKENSIQENENQPNKNTEAPNKAMEISNIFNEIEKIERTLSSLEKGDKKNENITKEDVKQDDHNVLPQKTTNNELTSVISLLEKFLSDKETDIQNTKEKLPKANSSGLSSPLNHKRYDPFNLNSETQSSHIHDLCNKNMADSHLCSRNEEKFREPRWGDDVEIGVPIFYGLESTAPT